MFGVREALDAAGEMLGPLAVALVLWLHGGYRLSFALLAVPALLCLAVLDRAWRRYPQPAKLETTPAPITRTRLRSKPIRAPQRSRPLQQRHRPTTVLATNARFATHRN